MSKSVRMTDIAQRLGVSTVTVSKALGDKEGVSESLRIKIKETAAEMGYHAPGTVKKKRIRGTGNIGILIPQQFMNHNRSFYWELYQRVITRLLSNHYYGILEVLSAEEEATILLPRFLQDHKVDGLIVIGQLSNEYVHALQTADPIPTMFLDAYDSSSGYDSVISDGYYGFYTLTSYLISMGHHAITFVGNTAATSSIRDRYFGYCSAMAEHQLLITPDMVLSDRDENGTISITLPKKLPTAFACNCDYTAYELIGALKHRGIRVPEEISVVGFDHDQFSKLSEPAITTYAVDMDTMARSCVERLIRKIHNPSHRSHLKIVSGQIIQKESVNRPQISTR